MFPYLDKGLDTLHEIDLNHLRVHSSPNLRSSRHELHHPCTSLPLLRRDAVKPSSTGSSISEFLGDPLSILRYQTLKRIQGNITKEKRLAAVTCVLISVFILCYLPFWSVYLCLVSTQSLMARQDMHRNNNWIWKQVKLNQDVISINFGCVP